MDRRTARRAFLKGCTASLTLAAVAACSPVVGVAGAGTGGLSPLPRERPNIVVIVSDDHGTDALGAYGNTYVQTPNLDALARDGTRFTSAFSTVSSCSPSRAAILSGKFVHANGMYGLSHLPYNFSSFPEITSFPKILSESGYRTALMGKFHVAPRTVYHFDRELATEDEVEAGLGRSPVEMAEGTRAFINEKDERPFLLYFAPTDPHRLGPYTLGESNHFGAKPGGYPGVTAIEYDPQKVTVPSFLPDLPETRQELAWYYQAVSRMDQGIGRLIAELKAADHVVLGLPMYNFGIPSQLKSWIDHVARAGITFRYTENGPQGLLDDKPVTVLAARGGLYAGTENDTVTPYIKLFFGFVGITDVSFVFTEGLNMGDESKEKAMSEARAALQ